MKSFQSEREREREREREGDRVKQQAREIPEANNPSQCRYIQLTNNVQSDSAAGHPLVLGDAGEGVDHFHSVLSSAASRELAQLQLGGPPGVKVARFKRSLNPSTDGLSISIPYHCGVLLEPALEWD